MIISNIYKKARFRDCSSPDLLISTILIKSIFMHRTLDKIGLRKDAFKRIQPMLWD